MVGEGFFLDVHEVATQNLHIDFVLDFLRELEKGVQSIGSGTVPKVSTIVLNKILQKNLTVLLWPQRSTRLTSRELRFGASSD